MNKGWYMMLKKYVLACLLACCIVNISAQSDWVEWEENTLEVTTVPLKMGIGL